MTGLTADAAAWRLVKANQRAGWGILGGADMRGVVRVVETVSLLSTSGVATATINQLAVAAGYSDRWTGDRLRVAEDLGLIRWRRGGIVNGDPTPSSFTVVKQALYALLAPARALRDADLARMRAALAARVAKYRLWNVTRRRKRRPVHVEATPYPPPFGGTDGPDPGPDRAETPGADTYSRGLAAARAAVRPLREAKP